VPSALSLPGGLFGSIGMDLVGTDAAGGLLGIVRVAASVAGGFGRVFGFGIVEGFGLLGGFGIVDGFGMVGGLGLHGGFGMVDGFGIVDGFGLLGGFGTADFRIVEVDGSGLVGRLMGDDFGLVGGLSDEARFTSPVSVNLGGRGVGFGCSSGSSVAVGFRFFLKSTSGDVGASLFSRRERFGDAFNFT